MTHNQFLKKIINWIIILSLGFQAIFLAHSYSIDPEDVFCIQLLSQACVSMLFITMCMVSYAYLKHPD